MSSSRALGGVLRKPLVEKLKIGALFALIFAVVYFSRPVKTVFYPGALLTLVGALVRVWAAGHLTRDQRLTTSGPYAHSRNPFYLGRLCLLVGFALMSGLQSLVVWAIFLFALAFFFLGYMPRKERREGGRLQQLFGDDYKLWRDNVPQLFPRLTPFVMNPRPWSKKLFFAGDDEFAGNKELLTTLATLALIGLFLVRMISR